MSFTILQLSDPHSTPTHRPLREVNAYLRATGANYDAIILNGDQLQRGHLDALPDLYEDAAALAELAPLIMVRGNHDDPHAGADLPGMGTGLVAVHDLGALRIVAIDSNPGRLGPADLAAIDEALASESELGTVIVMHHPPFPRSLPDLIIENFDQAEAFARLIAGRVRLILCGHYHQTTAGTLAGVPVWSSPALSYQRCVTTDTRNPNGWAERPTQSLEFSVIELDAIDFRAATVCLDPTIGGKQ